MFLLDTLISTRYFDDSCCNIIIMLSAPEFKFYDNHVDLVLTHSYNVKL